jgi:hypothetical protein
MRKKTCSGGDAFTKHSSNTHLKENQRRTRISFDETGFDERKERIGRTEQGGIVEDGGRDEGEDGDVVEFVGELMEFRFSPEGPEGPAEEVGPEGEAPGVQLGALQLRHKAVERGAPRARKHHRRRQLPRVRFPLTRPSQRVR